MSDDQKRDSWLSTHCDNKGHIGNTLTLPSGHTAWIGYLAGDASITLDGDFTAEELRDIAAWLDARRLRGDPP